MAKATPDALSQPDTRKSIDQHRYTAMATALWAAKHGKSPTDAGLKQPTPAETRRIQGGHLQLARRDWRPRSLHVPHGRARESETAPVPINDQ